MISRRTFMQHALAAGVVMALPGCSDAETRSGEVLMNHVGFPPHAAKIGLIPGERSDEIVVVERASSREIWRGRAIVTCGDMGAFGRFDCSDIRQAGAFDVCIADKTVAQFRVAERIYDDAIDKMVGYFAVQRCGDSSTGYHAPCHLDDGQLDGQHRDVTGGWHDACDLRKWVHATIYGMIGLIRVLDNVGEDHAKRARIIEELRWGNEYFLRMQQPPGYLMDHCGGDQGNYFTDNRIGTKDDRPIQSEPCDLPGQFHFVQAQAAMSRLLADVDAGESRRCLQAGLRCFNWCRENRDPQSALSLSAGLIATLELHNVSNDPAHETAAVEFADKLLALQVQQTREPLPAGFFRAKSDSPEPLRDIQHGNLPLLALCRLLRYLPAHADAITWRRAMELHLAHLDFMSQKSAFATIPYGLYREENPGGARRVGEYAYRWFMKPRGEYQAADWWVGINAHLASNGVGLAQAGRLLGDPRCARIAQSQLDWILGTNPFNASTVTDVGRNQPRLYRPSAFNPPTPHIAGGVMNGIGGTRDDQPTLMSGSYHTCEYWTPMVAYTMWLMSELQRAEAPDKPLK